jgi:hypothetical protein
MFGVKGKKKKKIIGFKAEKEKKMCNIWMSI